MRCLTSDFAERHRQPEWMDQPGLDPEHHKRALQGLARIHRFSRTASRIGKTVRELTSQSGPQPIRLLDVACGGGDLAISLAQQARRAGWNLQADGCDTSETAVSLAQKRAQADDLPSRFFTADVLHDPLPGDYDIVTCSLFLHHLAEEDIVSLLEKMAASSRHGMVVEDLLRSRTGYWLAWAGCRLLSGSPIVHHDGPASVRAALNLAEMHALLQRAGLNRATVGRHWPQRFLVVWKQA